ncbi:putative reverse transcriptase domain-containing protein [Tanacetum coccineum]|uniref:Reverse transcriptase domain-containing protein n=1 Tax=Tanacetum coccineum TaxID=301880 RepID=A0ABQ5BSC7_9ASTR
MTPESVQAMIDQALLRNSTNGDGSHSSHEDNRRNVQTARPCFYADFMKCQPLNFKGTEGVVGLTRWIEKMESVFNISGCAIENQVKFATCTLLGAALTWWNGQIRSLGPDAYSMTWEVLNKKITDKYCPQGEIKKLEIELSNLKVKGNDVPTYTERFQELTLICTKFIANDTEKIDKYISRLPDNIYGSVKSSRPKTLDETIELANDFMEQSNVPPNVRKADLINKGSLMNSILKNMAINNNPSETECRPEVLQYGVGSFGPANVANAIGTNRAVQGNECFECRAPDDFNNKNCPKLKNKASREMGKHKAWYKPIVNAEKNRSASRNPNSNVVTKDLMPVETGSFDVIIGIDWLRRCHAVIVCDEKLVRIPYGNETLIFRGDESNKGKESRLTIISCSKAQEYMARESNLSWQGYRQARREDKSKGKKLKDDQRFRFPEVFPGGLAVNFHLRETEEFRST